MGLTGKAATPNILRLMSADLPEVLDAWRMVAARRGFEGTLPLSSMARLRDALCDDAGVVRYTIGFDRDALGIPYVEVRAQADLPLTCQRTMERFLHPVQVVQRLAADGSEPAERMNPAELRKAVVREYAELERSVKELGLQFVK